MRKISNPELKAAVSAIMQRDQTQPAPGETPQLAELSKLRRAHDEWVRSELAKAGLDFGRLEKLYEEYKEEAGKLFEKLTPPDDAKPVEPTEIDREWTENKKRVYELIAGRPLVTFPIVLDAPAAIYSAPSGSLVDSHIGSWNSRARWKHDDSRSSSGWPFPDWEYATSGSCSPGKTRRRTWPSSSAPVLSRALTAMTSRCSNFLDQSYSPPVRPATNAAGFRIGKPSNGSRTSRSASPVIK